jgi:hypothetical protein
MNKRNNDDFPPPTSSRSMNALGVPFPQQNQFPSSNSVERVDRASFSEVDNTLKGISDALSSYENLKHGSQEKM